MQTTSFQEQLDKQLDMVLPLAERPASKTLMDEYGNVYPNAIPVPYDPKQSYKKDRKTAYGRACLIEREKLTEQMKILGNGDPFFFHFYNQFLSNISNDYQTAFRFLYICTFADNYGYLVKRGRGPRPTRRLDEDEVQELFGLTDKANAKILQTMYAYGLLESSPDGIKVNEDYFRIGKIPNSAKANGYIRVFYNGIQELYKKSMGREHKALGRIVSLLPYLHKDYNVLCRNPKAPNIDDVDALTMKEICNILGYNDNSQARITTFLVGITVGDHELFKVEKHKNRLVTYLNPMVFYAGIDTDRIQALIDSFKIGSNPRKSKTE